MSKTKCDSWNKLDNKMTLLIALWMLDKIVMLIMLWAMR
mgnify:CR=1 FL=1